MACVDGAEGHEGRTVRLEVPASAGYVELARLALSAVSRLTPLEPEDVADLKLAVTEAAGAFVGEMDGQRWPGAADAESTLRFSFELAEDELLVDVGCDGRPGLPEDEDELSRAIIGATVDRWESRPGAIRLVKQLRRPRE